MAVSKSEKSANISAKDENEFCNCNVIHEDVVNYVRERMLEQMQFEKLLQNEFCDDGTSIEISENSLQIIMRTKFAGNDDVFEKKGISIFIENTEKEFITLVLNPASIPENELENAVKALKNAMIF